MVIPYDLNDIQPRATKIWNYYGVGIYPNRIWSKVISTYEFFHVELMWKVKTG